MLDVKRCCHHGYLSKSIVFFLNLFLLQGLKLFNIRQFVFFYAPEVENITFLSRAMFENVEIEIEPLKSNPAVGIFGLMCSVFLVTKKAFY